MKKGLEISAGSKRLFGDDGKKDKVFVSKCCGYCEMHPLGAVVADSGNKVLRIPIANGGPASGKDVLISEFVVCWCGPIDAPGGSRLTMILISGAINIRADIVPSPSFK